ncbi:MAG: serine/threonine-protein phosphatase, partial [Anaerolineae bacterium]|nr:serine/threonine-protein phosphatase [Anaerolineae bacterium]
MSINFSYETNVGRKREVNEDSLWPKVDQHSHSATDPHGMLFIVADGMGGHMAGEVASALAITQISETYYGLDEEVTEVKERLQTAIRTAHEKIREEATLSSERERMGTTVAAAVVKYNEEEHIGTVWVGWVGDSRIYLLRQGHLTQLTKDHSFLWPQIEAGQLNWAQQRFHPQRSRINRALVAHHPVVTADVRSFELQPGDRLLLCSDGLYGEVEPENIEKTLASYPPAQAVHSLIEQANAPKEVVNDDKRYLLEGGDDNISAIIIDVDDQRQPSTASETVPDLPVIKPQRSRSATPVWGVLLLLILLGTGFFVYTNVYSNSTHDAGGVSPESAAAATESDSADQQSIVIVSLANQEYTPTPTVVGAELTAPEAESLQSEARQPTATRNPITLPTQPPSPTPTLLPTETPLPIVDTLLATPTPTETITATVESVVVIPEPVLVSPKPFGAGARQYSSNREIDFVWQWPGELTDNLSFEIRIWLPGQDRLGVHNASLLRQDSSFKRLGDDTYSVSILLNGAGGVKQT